MPPGWAMRGATLRGWLLPGQQRLHFKSEKDARRRQLLEAMCGLDVVVDVYDATGYGPRDQLKAREACLTRVVADAAGQRAERIVIELDESLEVHDKRTLFHATRLHGAADRLRYDLMPARSEPLLWIPDAIAWAWPKGGPWRDRARPIVRSVVTL